MTLEGGFNFGGFGLICVVILGLSAHPYVPIPDGDIVGASLLALRRPSPQSDFKFALDENLRSLLDETLYHFTLLLSPY